MKLSIKILVLLAILIPLFLGCDSSDTDTPKPAINFESQIKFSSAVIFWHQPIVYNDEQSKDMLRTELSATGISQTKYLYNFELNMSHLALKTAFGKSVKIDDGIFELYNESGNKIYGVYEGYGSLSEVPQNMELLLKIMGGTGQFDGVRGFLSGTSYLNGTYPGMRKMVLEGTIIGIGEKI